VKKGKKFIAVRLVAFYPSIFIDRKGRILFPVRFDHFVDKQDKEKIKSYIFLIIFNLTNYRIVENFDLDLYNKYGMIYY